MKNNKHIIRIVALLAALLVCLSLLAGCGEKVAQPEEVAKIKVTITVVNGDSSKDFVLETEKTTLADALLEADLVEGSESEYGLFITTVDGYTADYDANGEWWGIKDADGNDSMVGASSIEIKDGDKYQLVLTK